MAAVSAAVVLWRQTDPARRGDRPEPAGSEGAFDRLAVWIPPRPVTPLGRAAVAMWAGPLSVLGLLLAALGGGTARRVDGALVVAGVGGPMAAVLRRRGFSGTTLGQCVLVTPTAPPAALVAHELVHVRQAERLGIAFGPLYIALLARYGYHAHPMERAARLGAARASEGVSGSP